MICAQPPHIALYYALPCKAYWYSVTVQIVRQKHHGGQSTFTQLVITQKLYCCMISHIKSCFDVSLYQPP